MWRGACVSAWEGRREVCRVSSCPLVLHTRTRQAGALIRLGFAAAPLPLSALVRFTYPVCSLPQTPLPDGWIARATVFKGDTDVGHWDSAADMALLKNGKYLYVTGGQASATLDLGGGIVLAFPDADDDFVSDPNYIAQLEAKTGRVVAASNALTPSGGFNDVSLAVDGKGYLHVANPPYYEPTSICGEALPIDVGGANSYVAKVSTLSCSAATECTGAGGCVPRQA